MAAKFRILILLSRRVNINPEWDNHCMLTFCSNFYLSSNIEGEMVVVIVLMIVTMVVKVRVVVMVMVAVMVIVVVVIVVLVMMVVGSIY
jgi:hypothetical protein